MASRNPINAEDLRAELEALDGHAYNLQILRDRIDSSVGALHDQITAHDMANVRAFVRETVALWDRVSGLYESHTALREEDRPITQEGNRFFRLPRAADAAASTSGSFVREQAS